MKALSSMQTDSAFDTILDFLQEEKPVPVSSEAQTLMRPMQVKRFIHNLRENRQITYTDDFVF